MALYAYEPLLTTDGTRPVPGAVVGFYADTDAEFKSPLEVFTLEGESLGFSPVADDRGYINNAGGYMLPVQYGKSKSGDLPAVPVFSVRSVIEDAKGAVTAATSSATAARSAATDAAAAILAAQEAAAAAKAPTDDAVASVIQASTTKTAGAIAALIDTQVRGVPTYAGARTHTWDASRYLYNGESNALRNLRSLVSRSRNGSRTNIVAAGDSKTAGSGTGSGNAGRDSYPAQLIDIMGAREGLMYAERGSAGDARWTGRAGFTSIEDDSRAYLTAPAGVTSVITVAPSHPCVGANVYAYLAAAGSITVSVDGATPVTYPVAANSGFKKVPVTGLAEGAHTFTVTFTSAGSFLGVEPVYSNAGLVITNAGRSGSASANWLADSWARLAPTAFGQITNTALPAPDAVLFNIGTNDTDASLSNIDAAVANLVSLNVPVMLIVPGGVALNTSYNNRRKRIYDLADRFDLPLLDFTAVVGAYAQASAAGLMADTVHENRRGYALEAAAVARALSMI